MTSPFASSIVYDNRWRTNFAAWIGDGRRMSSRVRLWAFDRFESGPSLYSPATEARVPLAAARSTARPGRLPPARAGIVLRDASGLPRRAVAVTAFGPNPDGPGTVLRLWEQGGAGGRLAVTLPPGFRTATPIDLRGERRGDTFAIDNDTFEVDLEAYAPASFRLE